MTEADFSKADERCSTTGQTYTEVQCRYVVQAVLKNSFLKTILNKVKLSVFHSMESRWLYITRA